MAFPWMSLAQAANKWGTSKRLEREYYDYTGGGFEDPRKVERGFEAGSIFAPHKTLTDPDAPMYSKFMSMTGLGWLSNILGAGKEYRKNKEARLENIKKAAFDVLERTPGYEVPEESLELMATTQEGAEKVRQFSDEAVELAKESTGEQKAPGYDIIKEDIQTGQAQATQNVVEQAGVESLKSIPEIHAQTGDALKKLAFENMKWRGQARQEYKDTLGERARAEQAAVGLETMGLSEVAAQKDTQYQLEVLDSHYAKLQWEINATGGQFGVQQGQGGTQLMETAGMSLGSMFQSGAFKGGQQGSYAGSYNEPTPGKQAPLSKPY